MESLPQISLLVCAVGCGLLILLLGAVVFVLRSGVIQRLLGGLNETLSGTEAPDLTNGAESPINTYRQRSARSRADELRARYDAEFQSQSGVEPGVEPSVPRYTPPADEDQPADRGHDDRYSRRRRQEFEELDDELDAYFDDTEL